jgi:succinate dehydrogenase/fumarate reductase flavoprotein subunit
LKRGCSALLANSSSDLGVAGRTAAFHLSNFCKGKAKQRGAQNLSSRYQNALKEVTMEYLISLAVVSMMALYALIIVGCLREPEW